MSRFTFPSGYGPTEAEKALWKRRKKTDFVTIILIICASVIALHYLVIEPYLTPAQASAPILLDDRDYCRMFAEGRIDLEREEQRGAVEAHCAGLQITNKVD